MGKKQRSPEHSGQAARCDVSTSRDATSWSIALVADDPANFISLLMIYFFGLFTLTVWSLLRVNDRFFDGVFNFRFDGEFVPPLDSGTTWSMSFPLRSTPFLSMSYLARSLALRFDCSPRSSCCSYSFLYGLGLFTYGMKVPVNIYSLRSLLGERKAHLAYPRCAFTHDCAPTVQGTLSSPSPLVSNALPTVPAIHLLTLLSIYPNDQKRIAV